MLKFGGAGLGVDKDHDFEVFIAKYVPTSAYFPWRRASTPGFGTAGISYPVTMYQEPEFRLNRLHWPCWKISRWAYIHLLASSDMVDALLPYVCSAGEYASMPFVMGSKGPGVKDSEGKVVDKGEELEVDMYLLPPTPLSGFRGYTGPVQSLYLLTLVDLRYFLQFKNTEDMTSFMTKDTTWNDLYNELARVLDISLDIGPIPSEYLQPSIQMFNLPYEPAAIILDAVAANVGHRIVATYDGKFKAQTFSSANAARILDKAKNPDRTVVAGGFRFSTPT